MKLHDVARGAVLALALHAGAALASPLMELRAEDLLPMAPHLRTALALNPNQLLLWQQSEARSRALLRERQARRERLQKEATRLSGRADGELRELEVVAQAEAAASALEDAQLRNLWLTVNDALDDTQRRTVLRFLADQLERVRDGGAPGGGGGAGREGGHGGPGAGRGRGAGGGPGGPGGSAGGGGIGFQPL